MKWGNYVTNKGEIAQSAREFENENTIFKEKYLERVQISTSNIITIKGTEFIRTEFK